jgi:nucleotide-binding universal stress UspA family protein
MYRRILVPVDGSATSRRGLQEAIALAKSQGSDIRLIHIVNELVLDTCYSPGMYGSDIVESLRTAGRTVLSDAEAIVRREGLEPRHLGSAEAAAPSRTAVA